MSTGLTIARIVDLQPTSMPRWKSVDIDDLDDFDCAQWLAQRHPEWAA